MEGHDDHNANPHFMTVRLADIEAAAARLKGQAVETPLIESPALNARAGGRVLLKAETLQRVGAFKFRGAYNRLSQLSESQREAGVVAFSSGNHAQGVALAARLLGCPAVIVMPSDAPRVKMEATKAYGVEIRLYDRLTEDREAISAALAAQRGAVIVPAFNDLDIIAGQGTVGLEIARQTQALGASLDIVLAPVGGGGLMAGIATALEALSPASQLWGVEPDLFDDTRRSLAAGSRQSMKPNGRSLCDALESPSPGDLTFPILQRTLAGIVTVSDLEVAEAMRYAFTSLRLVVEPGGVVGLAALLAGKVKLAGRTAAIVLSGGNVDPELFSDILAGRRP
jgi:threonine dehydratase